MPVSSTPQRVALAPLNTNVATDSPLAKSRSFPTSLPLTPSLTPKFSLAKSATSIVPSKTSYTSARKFDSFSDYKISNSKTVKADLAATKLKLRLQLAFYKLKVQKRASVAASPNIRVSKPSLAPRPQNKTSPNFRGAANINLQNPRVASTPRLSAVAGQKSTLKLYHIKPSSSFHNPGHRLPLATQQRLPPVHKILKTPIKAANKAPVSASDETIDETADDSLTDPKKRDDFLGSSPLRHNFGTPNSFSVAKSLLQLGSGFY